MVDSIHRTLAVSLFLQVSYFTRYTAHLYIYERIEIWRRIKALGGENVQHLFTVWGLHGKPNTNGTLHGQATLELCPIKQDRY